MALVPSERAAKAKEKILRCSNSTPRRAAEALPLAALHRRGSRPNAANFYQCFLLGAFTCWKTCGVAWNRCSRSPRLST